MTDSTPASTAQNLRPSPSAPSSPAWAPGHVGATAETLSGSGAAPPPLSPGAYATLAAKFRNLLDAGVHGLCFSPYVDGQGPGSQVSEQQIRERLLKIAPYTRWVRSFSCTDGNENIPRIAHELGMKTLVGAWLGTDDAINQREMQAAIELARAGHADMLAIGNEVLLREDLGQDQLLAFIEQARRALPGVEIGYVDAYYLFEKHPRITAACDVVLTNCYPFWEGCPREQAIDYMQSMVRRTQAAAPGKRIVISETGWPDRGSAFHAAVPSTEGAMRYFIDTVEWAQRDGLDVFYFSAFDESWKVGSEGDVGAYWGLWDKDGQPKFVA